MNCSIDYIDSAGYSTLPENVALIAGTVFFVLLLVKDMFVECGTVRPTQQLSDKFYSILA